MSIRVLFGSIRRAAAVGSEPANAEYDYVFPSGWSSVRSGKSHVVVAIRWDRSAHLLGTTFHQRRHSRLRTLSLRGFCREIYNSSDCFARIPDSAVGGMLSLVLLPRLGLCSLLLREQLLDGWLWRYHASTELADVGATGEHCRSLDVRNFREPFVRDRFATPRPRKTFRMTKCNSCQPINRGTKVDFVHRQFRLFTHVPKAWAANSSAYAVFNLACSVPT